MAEEKPLEIGPDNSLLLLDDDEPFLRRLARAMEKRGFAVEAVETVDALEGNRNRPSPGLCSG